jgi:hypothetical protein
VIVSKRVEDGRRPPTLRVSHPRNCPKAVSGVARPQGVKGLGIAGPGETLGSLWIPLATWVCFCTASAPANNPLKSLHLGQNQIAILWSCNHPRVCHLWLAEKLADLRRGWQLAWGGCPRRGWLFAWLGGLAWSTRESWRITVTFL